VTKEVHFAHASLRAPVRDEVARLVSAARSALALIALFSSPESAQDNLAVSEISFDDAATWQPYFVFFRVRSIDDDRIRGDIMRRVVNGKTQYRKLTTDELREHVNDHAI
jgi:hypothetical protein